MAAVAQIVGREGLLDHITARLLDQRGGREKEREKRKKKKKKRKKRRRRRGETGR